MRFPQNPNHQVCHSCFNASQDLSVKYPHALLCQSVCLCLLPCVSLATRISSHLSSRLLTPSHQLYSFTSSAFPAEAEAAAAATTTTTTTAKQHSLNSSHYHCRCPFRLYDTHPSPRPHAKHAVRV